MTGLMLMISLCVFVSFTLAESTLDVDCGDPKTSTSGTLTYTGDAVAVFAYGANEPCKFEDNIDTGTRMLKINYDPTQDCAFIQDEGGAPWYTLKVESRMVHELFESGDDEKFLVDCNYMSIKTDITASIGIQEKPKEEEEYQLINNGNAAVSAFAIFVVRAADDVKLTGPIVQTTIVNLQSQMTPSGEEETYVPIECLAESSDGTVKVQILAAGCGTGFPWRKNQGFTVTTTKAKSPNFRMFRIQKQDNLVFRCSFVICDGDCNGSSCERGGKRRRRRRSLTKGLTYNSLGLIHSDSPKVRRARVAVSLNETFTLTQSALDQLNTNSSIVPLKLSL